MIRRWPLAVLWALAVTGVATGVALTEHHELARHGPQDVALHLPGCIESAWLSCAAMPRSAHAEVVGVPQVTWAIPTYLVLAGLAAAGLAGRAEVLRPILALGLFVAAYSGLMAWLSLTELGVLCSWCLALHAVNLLTPILAWVAGAGERPSVGRHAWGSAGMAWGITAMAAVGAQQAYRAHLAASAPREAPAPAPVAPWRGPAEAPVTLVLFGDLADPAARRVARSVADVAAAYPDQVRVGFRPAACDADCPVAVALACADAQGLFWPLHDRVLKNPHTLQDLRAQGVAVGVESRAWEDCLTSGRGLAATRAEVERARRDGFDRGPRVTVGEAVLQGGITATRIAREIELALGADPEHAERQALRLNRAAPDLPALGDDTPAMREVVHGDLRFRIDTFEAGVIDGQAESGPREVPTTGLTWYAARAACAAAGKRLCDEHEWVTACQGARSLDDDGDGAHADDAVEGTLWPYGDRYDPRACWEGKPPDRFRPVYTGEMPRCASSDGVVDLVGNVEEWAGTTPETAVLLGGAWDTPKEEATCHRRNDRFGPGYANRRTGARCCADAAAEAGPG